MNDFSNDKYDALLNKLQAGLTLSEKYRELTLSQKEAIASDDEMLLLSLLDERKTLITEIDELNKSLEPELAEYNNLENPIDERATELLNRSRAILRECVAVDQSNVKSISEMMKKAASDGRDMSKRREGILKYEKSDLFNPPEYLDRRQ